MNQKTRYENARFVVEALLKQAAPGVAVQMVWNECFIHPDFPELNAIGEILGAFQLRATIQTLTTSQLQGIHLPAIAKLQDGTLVLVTAVNNQYITLQTPKGRKEIQLGEFAYIFGGEVITVSQGRLSSPYARKATSGNSAALSIILSVITVNLIIYAAINHGSSYQINAALLSLTCLKLAGIMVCILLLMQSIAMNNTWLQRLCGKKGNCNSLLTSKASRITNWLSWAELGFFYFCGTFLALITRGFSPAVLTVLAWFNLLCLPYAIYSVYYQWRVAKAWCVLCCTVQVIFWAEFGLMHQYLSSGLDVGAILHALPALVIPVFAWLAIKPLWAQYQIRRKLSAEKHFDLFAGNTFWQLLQQQPFYNPPPAEDCITFGSHQPSAVITVISNPWCGSCDVAHQQLSSLLGTNKNLQVRIIFGGDGYNNQNIVAHIIGIYKQHGPAMAKQAMQQWYHEKPDPAEWMQLHPATEIDKAENSLSKQVEWCRENNIYQTPTILVNGYRLPSEYQLVQLKYILNRQVS